MLKSAGVESPEYDARLIFEHVGGINRHKLALSDTECEAEMIKDALDQRAKGEPLQYIIGRVGFYREEYKVTPDCLIPREDTEILVDYAVKNLPRGSKFIDLCTGSGCIAISTLKNTCETTAVAVDVSAAALKVAEENSRLCGVENRLELIELDLLNDGKRLLGQSFSAVLSNPPYVSLSEYGELERELYREPRIALTDEGDGSLFYRKLIPLSLKILDKGGFMAFEIGAGQGPLLRALADEYGLTVNIIKDFSGKDRVAVLKDT